MGFEKKEAPMGKEHNKVIEDARGRAIFKKGQSTFAGALLREILIYDEKGLKSKKSTEKLFPIFMEGSEML